MNEGKALVHIASWLRYGTQNFSKSYGVPIKQKFAGPCGTCPFYGAILVPKGAQKRILVALTNVHGRKCTFASMAINSHFVHY